MTISIRSNLAATAASRQLGRVTKDLQDTSAHLSSGLRINKASDDAAGISTSSLLKNDAKVYAQGIRNLNDGTSVLNVAEGALTQLSNIVIRQKELAEQAANGVYSGKQRVALNAEANALVKEYNRIVQSVTFNNTKILDGTGDSFRLQGGYGVNGGIQINLGQQLGTLANDGTFLAGLIGGSPATPASGEITTFDFSTISSWNSAGPGLSFSLSSSRGVTYYIWLNTIDDGPNSDPGGTGIGIQVDVSKGDSPAGIAAAVQTAIDGTGDFDTVLLGTQLTVTDRSTGDAIDAYDVDLGVTVTKNADGTNGDAGSPGSGGYSAGTAPQDIKSADLNGDGIPDLVVANSSGSKVTVLLANSNGTFRAPVSFAVGNSSYGVELADVNNDGIIDIIGGSYGTAQACILLGNGNGTFTAARSYAVESGMWGMTAADFNGDGVVDLAFTGYGGSNGSILIGNGDGSFKARRTYFTGTGAAQVASTDFNGDGIADLVFSHYSGAGNFTSVLIGNGDGSFRAKTSLATGGASAQGVSTGDLNGDGFADIVVNNNASSFFSIFIGNGDGSFRAVQTSAVGGGQAFRNVLIDINGDGTLDYVSGAGSTAIVALGNGNGTFMAATSTPASSGSTTAVAVKDFNGDGVLDIAGVDSGLGTVSIQLGNGDSSGRRNNWTYAIDISNILAARQSLTTLTTQLTKIDQELGVVGAYQSRISASLDNLAIGRTNFETAESRITNADVAEDSAKLVFNSVLQKAAIAVLAQANLAPELALTLLRGRS